MTAHDHRELHQAVLAQVFVHQRRVGGAEVHGLGLDLPDAAARADRLVVEADAGRVPIGVGPLGEYREGKLKPAPEMSVAKAGRTAADNNARRRQSFPDFHELISFQRNFGAGDRLPRRPIVPDWAIFLGNVCWALTIGYPVEVYQQPPEWLGLARHCGMSAR